MKLLHDVPYDGHTRIAVRKAHGILARQSRTRSQERTEFLCLTSTGDAGMPKTGAKNLTDLLSAFDCTAHNNKELQRAHVCGFVDDV